MAAKTVSLHVTMAESDYLLLGHEMVRRRMTGRGHLLLSLASPALAKLRRESGEQSESETADEQR